MSDYKIYEIENAIKLMNRKRIITEICANTQIKE